MLSSIASFLPSALHLNNNNTQEYQQVGPTINPDTDDEDEHGEDDVRRNGNAPRSSVQQRQEESTTEANGHPQGAKGAAKSANETFIFVRPPPSKSNHPLNLQVQLVPPHGRPPTGVAPQDDATTPTTPRSRSSSNAESGTGTTLVRTNSRRSEVYTTDNDTPNTTPTSTTTNTNASTSSFASTASFTFSTTSSSSSGRRTIIPLYNLQAHNVLTNVIVDAGTDAKIARFQKRGIEMMEVGVLEPVEVWGEKERGREKGKKRDSLRLSVDEMSSNWNGGGKPRNSFLQPGGVGVGGSRPGTPSATSSKTSLHSSSHSNMRMASPAPVLAATFSPLNTEQQQQQQQQPPILDSTTPTPIPVLPPQTQTQIQFMTQAPPQKRNIFNKLFNKRSTTIAPPPPPSSLGLGGTTNNTSEPEPSFGTFSLHPAPVSNKVVVQDFDKRGGGKNKAPSPLLLTPPQSPGSQQTTPKQMQIPRPDLGNEAEEGDDDEGLVSPTPTVAPPKEGRHGRNSSLTVPFMNNPFKTTLIRSGKNRLSAVVGGGGNGEKEKEREREERVKREEKKEAEKDKRSSLSLLQQQQKRDASSSSSSPAAAANAGLKRVSRSQLSLPGGGSNVELNNGGGGAPLMLTQSQAREELSNLKQQQLALRPPILGIQPTFVSPAVAPPNPLGSVASPLVAALSPRMSDATQENLLVGQRALMYVWLVRKWLKRRPVVEGESGNMFGESGLFGGFNLKGNHVPGLGYGGVEVRFEWKRAKAKSGKEGKEGRKRRGRASTGTVGVESDDEFVVRPTDREERRSVSANVKERLLDKKKNRMSTGSFSTTTASEEGGGEGSIRGKSRPRREGTIDDGEDSDPEDSETPWVCTLKIRRMGGAAADMVSPPASAFSDAGFPKSTAQPQILRLKVGTLSPTPHHPKVVAMLKVPFPLPDVEVERMGVVRRKGFSPQEQQREEEEREPYYGLTLTAEEIKDIVCSTGLWLVVREGFGGVGRVSRKGDGWRIRA